MTESPKPFDGYEEYLSIAGKVAANEAVLLIHPHVRAAVLFLLGREEKLRAEVDRLKEQLAAVNRSLTRRDAE